MSEISADVIEVLKTRNSERLKIILLTSDQITIANESFLLLHEAILRDFNNEILGLILWRGADINSQDHDGYTPLHLAVLFSHNPQCLIDFLLRRGADPKIPDFDGETPHFCAVRQEQFQNSLKILGRKNVDLHLYEKYFHLCTSIFNRPSKAINFLKNSNFDVNFSKLQGVESPLYYAVMKKDLKVVQKLLDRGANPNRDFCLQRAIKNYSLGIVKALIRSGADPQDLDEHRNSTLNLASTNADFQLVDFFSKLRVDPNLPNHEGQVPLHTSCRYSCLESVKILLKMGSRVDARDSFGNTALHHCSKGDQDPRVFEELLKRGAEVNARNNEGRTPLSDCKRCGPMILLLRAGGVPGKSDYWCQCYGQTCPVIVHLEKLRLLGFRRGEAGNCGLEDQWTAELKAMKNVELAFIGKKKVRLYDFLFMGRVEAEKYAGNENLARVYEDSGRDFGNLFPHYGFLINRHYRKILERRKWTVEADNLLSNVLERRIPETCSQLIFGHLSDKDLRMLCQDLNDKQDTGMSKNVWSYFGNNCNLQ